MKYGICWYTGVGEHDYEESSRGEFASVAEVLESLLAVTRTFASEDLLFDALDYGRQDTIYWLTDDFGFALFRPGES